MEVGRTADPDWAALAGRVYAIKATFRCRSCTAATQLNGVVSADLVPKPVSYQIEVSAVSVR
jgi:hypothetical protein